VCFPAVPTDKEFSGLLKFGSAGQAFRQTATEDRPPLGQLQRYVRQFSPMARSFAYQQRLHHGDQFTAI